MAYQMSVSGVNKEGLTKTQIINEFVSDQMVLDEYLPDQAKEMGISTLALAKRIAEEEFAIGLEDGTIIKVGRRYNVL